MGHSQKHMEAVERIRRIRYMERILDEAAEALRCAAWEPERYLAIQPRLEELAAYYSSDTWKRDLDADTAGDIPGDLKRGVLSQDTVYDLLTENLEYLTAMRTRNRESE